MILWFLETCSSWHALQRLGRALGFALELLGCCIALPEPEKELMLMQDTPCPPGTQRWDA